MTDTQDIYKALEDPVIMRFNEILIWFYKQILDLEDK